MASKRKHDDININNGNTQVTGDSSDTNTASNTVTVTTTTTATTVPSIGTSAANTGESSKRAAVAMDNGSTPTPMTATAVSGADKSAVTSPTAAATPSTPSTSSATPTPTETKSTSVLTKDKRKWSQKRAVAVIIMYNGSDHSGMQFNPGVKTIESTIEEAMWRAGAITDDNYGHPHKVNWQRASRTDKGVHAAGNIINVKLMVGDDTVKQINDHLPPNIRIVDVMRVINSFHAKRMCSSRTYEYLLPTYAFMDRSLCAPQAGVDGKEMSLPSSIFSYRMPQDVHDRVNRLLGVYHGTHNYHNFTATRAAKRSRHASDNYNNRFMEIFHIKDKFIHEGVEFARLVVHGQSFMLHQIRKMVGLVIAVARGSIVEDTVFPAALEDARRARDAKKLERERRRDEIGKAIAAGTRTPGWQLEADEAKRNELKDKERIKPAKVEEAGIFSYKLARVPQAPALGLLLDRCHFERYALKLGQVSRGQTTSAGNRDIDTALVESIPVREAFKKDFIYADICKREVEQSSMAKWLASVDNPEHWTRPIGTVADISDDEVDDDDGDDSGGEETGKSKDKGEKKDDGKKKGKKKGGAATGGASAANADDTWQQGGWKGKAGRPYRGKRNKQDKEDGNGTSGTSATDATPETTPADDTGNGDEKKKSRTPHHKGAPGIGRRGRVEWTTGDDWRANEKLVKGAGLAKPGAILVAPGDRPLPTPTPTPASSAIAGTGSMTTPTPSVATTPTTISSSSST